jgi:hypothetical protein
MGSVAALLVDDDTVTVQLTALEKAEALHGNVVVPRSAVRAFWTVPDGQAEVAGFKLIGSGLTGVIKVGTWRSADRTIFAVCHGSRPAVVLDLTGAQYDRLVVTVDNPEEAIAGLS